MKRWVMGDIHGAHKALVQCFERSGLDPAKDLLVSVGDVCDGWPEVDKAFNELLDVKNFVMVRGNHDDWALKWMEDGWQGQEWMGQGGAATLESYGWDRSRVPREHVELLKNTPFYYELEDKLFVHGGIAPGRKLTAQDPGVLMWDRDLLKDAVRAEFGGHVPNSKSGTCPPNSNPPHRYGRWEAIFVGHTTTQMFGTLKPVHACNVWDLDTCAGWGGPLTIMDIDTREYWQSDKTSSLYSGVHGR